ncbi:MAG: thermonuclease family protein [Hyphomicrobium sp.]
MFGWRRRSEGFEWREYVRTTVLVRRADRQRKIDDVRMAAVNKVIDTKDRGVAAGRAGVETATLTISEIFKAASRRVWSVVIAGASAGWRVLSRAAGAAMQRMPVVSRPKVSFPSRASFAGSADRARSMLPDVGMRSLFNARLPFNPRLLGGAAVAVALIYIGGPMLRGDATFSAATPFVAAPAGSAQRASRDTTGLAGRATAIKGDLLRVDGKLVQLTGIEVPEPKQPCLKGNGRRWNCSAAARSALDKLVRGKDVSCAPSGETEYGHVLAVCAVNGVDLGDALVRKGHAFANSGLLATYGSAESEAKSAQIGVWQGEAVRPSDWRDQVWQEAKRTAPDGCPIKGTVRASDRFYALPWSNGYDGAKVRTVKGDRWFCSEEEARAAGFRLSSRL